MSNLITEYLSAKTLSPKAISRIAVCTALFLAPMMIYGSAYLVYGQIEKVNTTHNEAVQAKTATKVSLSRSDSEQIAAAIALAYSN